MGISRSTIRCDHRIRLHCDEYEVLEGFSYRIGGYQMHVYLLLRDDLLVYRSSLEELLFLLDDLFPSSDSLSHPPGPRLALMVPSSLFLFSFLPSLESFSSPFFELLRVLLSFDRSLLSSSLLSYEYSRSRRDVRFSDFTGLSDPDRLLFPPSPP